MSKNNSFIPESSLTRNLITLNTITRREIYRFIRIWGQTLLPPIITQSLYFIIFGLFIGRQLSNVNGVPYQAFVVPGLVMMSVITASFSNVVSSFFGSKFQRNIEELLVSPTPNWVIIAGYSIGGIARGFLVGIIVYLVAFFFNQELLAPQNLANPFIILLFIFLTATVFSLGGLINGVFAKKFDDIGIFATFILTPLTYLGGIFYPISALPPLWQNISKINPIVYMIDGFRGGFFGETDFNIWVSASALVITTIVMWIVCQVLMRKGIGLRS